MLLRVIGTICVLVLTVDAVWMPAHQGDRWTAWGAVSVGVTALVAVWS
jgi:hypothetical protein